jgi:hypothetical protein
VFSSQTNDDVANFMVYASNGDGSTLVRFLKGTQHETWMVYGTKMMVVGDKDDFSGNLRILNFAPPRLGHLSPASEVTRGHTLPF